MAADRPKAKGYLDEDTTDAYLDLPEPRYAPHGRVATREDTDRRLEQAARGEVTLPNLPPPVPD